jgi:hypothetical protein
VNQVDVVRSDPGPLLGLVCSLADDLAASRDELDGLNVEARQAIGARRVSVTIDGAPVAATEVIRLWAEVSAELDGHAERLATRQRDVLALIDAALARSREEGDVQGADTKPGVWGSPWEPPVLPLSSIDAESEQPIGVPSPHQRLARVLLVLGSTLIVVAMLVLVV